MDIDKIIKELTIEAFGHAMLFQFPLAFCAHNLTGKILFKPVLCKDDDRKFYFRFRRYNKIHKIK